MGIWQNDLPVKRSCKKPGACCIDDSHEPDDGPTTAQELVGTTFSENICPSNADYITFEVPSASALSIVLNFVHANGDLDLRLYAVDTTVMPPTTRQVAYSVGVTDGERIEYDTPAGGTYVLRVNGVGSAANSYTGTVNVTPITGCDVTRECALGRVCEAGTCSSDACTMDSDCPDMHRCPSYGTGAARHCGQVCSISAECRAGEACKWFNEARVCAVTGTATLGAACTSASDCSGTRSCVPWPGGMCTRAGCRTQTDCESGTFCVVVGGRNVCALDCETDIGRCGSRDYLCETAAAPGATGVTHNVCVPPP